MTKTAQDTSSEKASTRRAFSDHFKGLPYGPIVAAALAWVVDTTGALYTIPLIEASLRIDFIGLAVLCIIAALCPDAVERLMRNRRFIPLCCLVGIGGAAAALITYCLSASPFWSILSFAAISVFQAAMLLYCFCILSQLSMRRAMLSIALWLAVIGASLALLNLSNNCWISRIACIAIPPCVFLLTKNTTMPPRAESAKDRPDAQSSRSSGIPFNLLIVQFTVLAVVKSINVLVDLNFRLVTGIGFLLATVGIVVFLLRGKKLLQLKGLYNCALLLSELALFFIAFESAAAQIGAGILAGASYTVFAAFCFTIYCTICLRYSVNPLRMFGLAFACECLASFTAYQLMPLALSFDDSQMKVLLALSVIIAVVFLMLFRDIDYRTNWGTRKQQPSTEQIVQYYYSLPDVCSAVARQYGLSKREEDILLLISQKKTAPDIASELFISLPTVKSHTHNIYRKLEIHSRQELFEMIDFPQLAQTDEPQ